MALTAEQQAQVDFQNATEAARHALIGTTSLVGAVELTEILRQVERWSWQTKMAEVVDVLPTLEHLFAGVEREVEHTTRECANAAWREAYCLRQGV